MRNHLCYRSVFISLFCFIVCSWLVVAQGPAGSLQKVLTLSGNEGPKQLSADSGLSGIWQKLLKLQTTASAIHTTAHPDDENGGMLTYLSRGQGVRTALLTLNRGEGGANAIGSELFDGLGLIRTEELLISDRYYGLDDQYFTTVVDYGYSKRLEEALDKWGRENVLRDVVRIIRINRPFVIISRFHGSERDGHGNHQTAGIISQEAFQAAADPSRFPEQIEEGLRPWQPLKMYRGGVRAEENEKWHVRINAGEYSPWLGKSYRQFASEGLSYQRSQTSGRLRDIVGPYYRYYERMDSTVDSGEKESTFFDGIDTSLTGVYSVTGETAPGGAVALLEQVEEAVDGAVGAYNARNPSTLVSDLTKGLKLTREVIALSKNTPDSHFLLKIEEEQFMDAINAALGIYFRAQGLLEEPSAEESFWSAPSTMGPVVPGQQFFVETTFLNRAGAQVTLKEIKLQPGEEPADGTWKITPRSLSNGGEGPAQQLFQVTVPQNPSYSTRYFTRDSIQEARYRLADPKFFGLPERAPALTAVARYDVDGVPVEIREVVRTLESDLPYGHVWRALKVLPAVAVNVEPDMRIIPLGQKSNAFTVQAEVINNDPKGVQGQLQLNTPDGWTAKPSVHDFSFSQAGERRNFSFSVSASDLRNQDYSITAVARVGGKKYGQGYQVIRHRDYDTNYLFEDANLKVRAVDVDIAPDLTVGYIMGVGDEVPSGIEQLGATVELLGRQELATGNLSRYDTIVIGTRAYAVREDLITYNNRLIDWVGDGGNLVVLYQTQEFDPNKWAPYPAELPRRAEEISEEDAPVKILASDHPVFNVPNEITLADFENWVEQRGSKFFSQWDQAYTPLIESHDQEQDPQQGGCLTAEYEEGYYSYCAYAFHRQLPYAVPGAYRLFANFLSLGNAR